MILDRRLHPVESAIASSTLLPHDGVVVVAVSGGADSMALVEALRESSRVVAHFDHRLREESARDAEHVAAYARIHGLEFILGSEDVAQRARARRTSIEEAARDARYEFLSAVAARFAATRIATAHTRCDQVETILMRILRGTGRVGLAGIPAERGALVRPLLEVTGADTRDYCEVRGVAFVDDPSNGDVRFFRNRVRHDILPSLRAAYPGIDDVLLRLAEAARREQRAFAVRTHGWLEANVSEEESRVWALRLAGFDSIDDDDATALLRDVFVHTGLARDVGRAHYERLLGLVRSAHAGAAVDLPGCSARREHDALVLWPRPTRSSLSAHVLARDHNLVSYRAAEIASRDRSHRPLRPAAGVADGAPAASGGGVIGDRTRRAAFATQLAVPGRAHAGDWIIEADYVSDDDARAAIARGVEGGVAYFDADAISNRLVARSLREGDAMRPFGLGGRKKLSDLFVDRKIPRRRRADAIVIEGETIHWVPGLATSETGRIVPGTTRVVRLKATRG